MAPPKYRPPQASVKKFGAPSASRWPQVPEPVDVVNERCPGAPPAQLHTGPDVVVVVVDVVVVVRVGSIQSQII